MLRRIAILGGLIPALVLVGLAGASGTPARRALPTSQARHLVLPATWGRALATTSRARVRIVDFAFKPKILTIPKGTRVRWINRGSVAHTSTSKTGTWDSGSIAPGDSFGRVFRKRGTFRFHCSIHPGMKGKIVVK